MSAVVAALLQTYQLGKTNGHVFPALPSWFAPAFAKLLTDVNPQPYGFQSGRC